MNRSLCSREEHSNRGDSRGQRRGDVKILKVLKTVGETGRSRRHGFGQVREGAVERMSKTAGREGAARVSWHSVSLGIRVRGGTPEPRLET